MPKLRLLVVDDSVVMRRLITEAMVGVDYIEVVGSASNGRIAVQKITQVNPDVVTLDVEMPEMDGVQTLREIRKEHPSLPVIMVSALTQKGASATLDALSAGANDYVTKPVDSADLSESLRCLRAELLPRINAHCRRELPPVQPPTPPTPLRETGSWPPFVGTRAPSASPIELVCIASSTGGPVALEQLFKGFAAPLPVPVAIVQHMPPMFTQMLAERLDGLKGTLRCEEARHGLRLAPARACLAMGGRHLALARNRQGEIEAHLTDTPPENSCRPAADVLFRSAASLGVPVLGVVLTGMGSDGMRGCQHLREAGAQILAQDEPSSVVWGMPGAVVQARLADAVLPLREMAAEISRRVRAGRSK